MKQLIIAAIAALLATTLVAPAASASTPAAERSAYQPSWHRVHFHMNAYEGAGPGAICHGYSYHEHGYCVGYGEHGPSGLSHPFEGHVEWYWQNRATRCADFPGRDADHWRHEVMLRRPDGMGVSALCGWVDRHWGTFRLTGGQVLVDGHTRRVHATSGVVADREHVQGGPLFMFLGDRGTRGYVMGLRGWLYY